MSIEQAKVATQKMRFHALDLMRFSAALAVVFYHYITYYDASVFPFLSKIAKYGYLGVPLFFMISGFVISASAENRSPLAFLISRAARLYPAYWLGIIFTSGVLLTLTSVELSLIDFFANFTMFNTYIGVPSIDGVYWTLHAELKFYGCIFLLMLTGAYKYYRVWLTLWTAAAVTYFFIEQPFFLGWFISPAYSTFFISGVAFYLLWSKGPKPFVLASLFASSTLSCLTAFEQTSQFIAPATYIDRVVSASLVGIFHILFALLSTNKLDLKPRGLYLILGGITFPLYLFHNAAGKAILDYPHLPISNIGVLVALLTALMLVLAYLVYAHIEQPISRAFRKMLESMFSLCATIWSSKAGLLRQKSSRQ